MVFEVDHSAVEIVGMFSGYGFKVGCVKGCCYWHLLPILEACYPFWLDSFFNLFRSLLKYAEIHAVLMTRKHRAL